MQAKSKCKDLIIVEPHYDRYQKFSKIAREIYKQYTDLIESFGLDECWLDITGSHFGSSEEVALKIREQIKFELGVTASVGVSFNKIFAKLGSDLKKPDATTVISKSDFKEKIWHLPANEMLNVGPATYKKLCKYGITTIGELAKSDCKFLERVLGKCGLMLWKYANGYDDSPVAASNKEILPKSIGNSTTTPHNLITDTDIKITLNTLCDSVSARLRENNLLCGTVQIYVRLNTLESYERQTKLIYPNRTSNCLANTAFKLFKQNHPPCRPVRILFNY